MPEDRQTIRAREIYELELEIRIIKSELEFTKRRYPHAKTTPRYISTLERYIERLRNSEQILYDYIDSIKNDDVRQVVKYRAIDDMTIEQIAEIMSYSISTIKRLWDRRP